MREIILDTETTGLNPQDGHRIVEIGCVELINYVPTGRTFHQYINPERDVPEDAAAVHGLTTEKLAPYPVFSQIAAPFLEFIGDSPLVIHNAEFDIKFLNAELARLGLSTFPSNRGICTVQMSRRQFPGAPANLDALCRRFNVDNSARHFHGALLDCHLLAACYLELRGGRQPGFGLTSNMGNSAVAIGIERPYRAPRPHTPTEEELAAHSQMLKGLKDNLWLEINKTSQ